MITEPEVATDATVAPAFVVLTNPGFPLLEVCGAVHPLGTIMVATELAR